jgi:hypothetical protein
MTGINGFSTLAASLMLEYTDITLREGIQIFAVLQVVSGIIWIMLMMPGEKRFAQATSS